MVSMPTLYGLDYSVYTRIARLALEEKEVQYLLEEADIFADAGPPESHLKLQPFGKIPVFVHQDFTLYETRAITAYVDEAFDGPPLQPEAAGLRARMAQTISVLDAYAYRPLIWPIFVERVSVPREGGAPNEQAIDAAMPMANKAVGALDALLGDQPFFVGAELSLADLHAAPIILYFSLTPEGGTLLDGHPRVRGWLETMLARPSAVRTRCRFGY